MRLFVALEIPQETRTAMARLISQLKPQCPMAKWVRPEGMHVTLKFIGHAAPLAADIDQALAKLGVEPEARRFTPHLTLARLDPEKLLRHGKPSAELAELGRAAQQRAAEDFGALRTNEFHLFDSRLEPTGAEYTSLETFRFA